MISLEKASDFMDMHARLVDRRRFDLLFRGGEADGVVAALAAYANADGGFGWALEPDLRSPSSQPAGALHAFEFLEEIAPATSPLAARLCDWLESVTLADGGVPFALPGAAGPGTAPWWAGADHARSSLHITSAVVAIAHRVALHDPAVAGHPWLARATEYCRGEIANLEGPRFAIEFSFVLQLLDVLDDPELERLAAFLPASGEMAVQGGAEGERMRPLDFSPWPDRPMRRLLSPQVIREDLDRLAAEQLDDGGWDVDFNPVTKAAALEWRGYATVGALKILTANAQAPQSLAT